MQRVHNSFGSKYECTPLRCFVRYSFVLPRALSITSCPAQPAWPGATFSRRRCNGRGMLSGWGTYHQSRWVNVTRVQGCGFVLFCVFLQPGDRRLDTTSYLYCERRVSWRTRHHTGPWVRTGRAKQHSYSGANHRQEAWGYESGIAWLGLLPGYRPSRSPRAWGRSATSDKELGFVLQPLGGRGKAGEPKLTASEMTFPPGA